MVSELKNKLYRNSLILDRIVKLDKYERKEILSELLKDKSERQLAGELGLPTSTLHDWASLRQSNIGKDIHISFNGFYRKLVALKPSDITDWGRLEQIKRIIEELLKSKTKGF